MAEQDFDYGRYLASREWALLKQEVRKRSRGLCERCHGGPHEQTHHLTYQRIGHELPEDLQGVCRPCHRYLSGRSNDDPLVISPSEQASDEVPATSGLVSNHVTPVDEYVPLESNKHRDGLSQRDKVSAAMLGAQEEERRRIEAWVLSNALRERCQGIKDSGMPCHQFVGSGRRVGQTTNRVRGYCLSHAWQAGLAELVGG